MLCSRCSERIRPVVGIDIDGTLGQYHAHFWDFLRMYLAVPCPDPTPIYDGRESFREWGMRNYGIDERTWYDIKLAWRQGAGKRLMPIRRGAASFVRSIRDLASEPEIWITTTRPYNRLDNVDPDSREWLRRHDVPFDHLLYDDDKYVTLSERVDPERVVAVLDDLPDMCLAAAVAFGPNVPILMRTDFNLGVLDQVPFVANTYTDATKMIHQRIKLWERKHRGEADHG